MSEARTFKSIGEGFLHLPRGINLLGLIYPVLPDFVVVEWLSAGLRRLGSWLSELYGFLGIEFSISESYLATFTAITLPLYLLGWGRHGLGIVAGLLRAIMLLIGLAVTVSLIRSGLDGSVGPDFWTASQYTTIVTGMTFWAGTMIFARRQFLWTVGWTLSLLVAAFLPSVFLLVVRAV